MDQPRWAELSSHQQAVDFASEVGYPVLVRPSFVLSGAAMKVCRDEEGLRAHLDIAKEVSQDYPVVVSQFVRGARELEMDGVAKDGRSSAARRTSTSKMPGFTVVMLLCCYRPRLYRIMC